MNEALLVIISWDTYYTYFYITGRERAPLMSDPCDGETSSIQSTI